MSARLSEVYSLMERHEREPEHVQQVARLALMLFDQLDALHRLSREDRETLEAAALLHDIGWAKSPMGRRHHKWSYKIIRDYNWKLWEEREIELIANVARYHRKATPNLGHKPYAKLRPAEQSRVLRLAALLRLADALDRGHRSAVRSLRCRDGGSCLTIEVEAETGLTVERECLPKKTQLFEQVYGREVRIA